MVNSNQHDTSSRQPSVASSAEMSQAAIASTNLPRHSSPQQQHQQLQPQVSGYSQFQPPPQYPAAFAPRTTQNPPQSHTQFHHHQPAPPRSTNVTTTRHQITAPFQIPRLPHPWPYPGAHRGELSAGGGSWSGRGAGGANETSGGNVPIDPRLLGHSRTTGKSPELHSHQPGVGPPGRGGQGGWPPSSEG